MRLAAKLGDDDPAVREEATQKLTQVGKAALPALREAAGGDDPEARLRAEGLIRRIERRIPPPGPDPRPGSRMQSVSTTMARGVRTIEVNDNGQKIHITCQNDGAIEMSVTGVEDGKEATETYKARDAGELKRDSPEAFALYDKWAGNAQGQAIHVGPFGPAGPMVGVRVFPGAPGGPPGGPPGAPPANPQAPQLPPDLHDHIEQQLREANVPPEQRERMLAQIRRVEEMNHRAQEQAEQRVHDRMRGEDAEKAGTPEKRGEKKDSE